MKVWQSELGDYIEMPILGKLKYVGESFSLGLTNGKTYPVVRIETGLFGIVDDVDEDYLYSPTNPAPLDGSSPGGKWEIIEDPDGALAPLINQ